VYSLMRMSRSCAPSCTSKPTTPVSYVPTALTCAPSDRGVDRGGAAGAVAFGPPPAGVGDLGTIAAADLGAGDLGVADASVNDAAAPLDAGTAAAAPLGAGGAAGGG